MNHSSESSNPFRRPVHSSEYTSAGARPVHPVPLPDRYNGTDVDPTDLEAPPKAFNTYAQQPPLSTTTKKQVRISSPPRSPSLPLASASPLPDEYAPTSYSFGAYNESLSPVETRSAPSQITQHPRTRKRSSSSSSSSEEDSSSGEEEAERSKAIPNMASATASEGRAVSHTPPNPFSRTLADMEQSLGSSSVEKTPEAAESQGSQAERSNRHTMDVNAFKTLLMTGKTSAEAPPKQYQQPRSAATAALTLADNSSSTDTSSISRHSIMDNPATGHETPRSSYERSLSDDEEEDNALPQRTLSKRVKPPLPRHRHGKSVTGMGPQIVAFDDFSKMGQQEAEITSPVSEERAMKSRSSSETKKPLPPLPPTVRGTAMREALAGAAISSEHVQDPTPSPDITATDYPTLTQPKKPPPPPLARRSSQRAPMPSLERTRSNAGSIRHSRMDDNESIAESTTSSRAAPPPPPPARRSGGHSSTSVSRDESSPASIHRAPSLKSPPPPPARNRATSNLSATSIPPPVSAGHTPTQSTSTPANHPPKPPPPRRTSSRSSIDLPAPRRTSGEIIRSSFDSERRPSFSSSIRRAPITEEEGGESPVVVTSPMSASSGSGPGQGKDILADMDRLQQEIDALMAKDEIGRRKGSAGSGSMQRPSET